MKVSDIKEVVVDWMKQYANNPQLKFILKRDRTLTPWDQFRFRQHGNIFYAEHEGEVRYLYHDPRDHHGFAGSGYTCHMADDWDESQWKDCPPVEYAWGHHGKAAGCHRDGQRVFLVGPWSSGASVVSRLISPVVSVSVLEGNDRMTIRNPKYYARLRKRNPGHPYYGTFYATSCTLDFCRQAIAELAPWLEMYEGDYGWYPVLQGEPPKNPRRGRQRVFSPECSDEQSMGIEM